MITHDSRKRFEDEGDSEDQRDPFERDRDRILYSSAFRRLAGVTQVVNPAEGHIFHNRLTHSIKVAQLGRRLAERLQGMDSAKAERLQINPEVVEAAALAHDLGHPPFGHVGELVINECMHSFGKGKRSMGGYDGNAQAFRIVTKLSMREELQQGLNLTRLTLNALLKYPWFRKKTGEKRVKWGANHSEKKYFKFARKGFVGDKQHACAFLMDWADDIAYSTHDIEDFYRARLIPLDRLATDDKECEQFLSSQFKDAEEYKKAEQALDEIRGFIYSPLSVPFSGSCEQRGALKFFISRLVGKCVRAVDFEKASSPPGLKIDPSLQSKVRVLKKLACHYVFSNSTLAKQQYGQKRIVKETFEILFDLSLKPKAGKIPLNLDVLPISIRHYFDHRHRNARTDIARYVADAIALMTEQELYAFHRRLTGADPGSVLNIVPQ